MMQSSVQRTPRLGEFQNAFATALVNDDATLIGDVWLANLIAQPGFAVYRNTVMKGCVDALLANFPAVTRLVGEAWLGAAAAVFVRDRLPRQPSLVDYGADFPDFLAGFAPAAELPYLADVARLDRWWTEAHVAADAERFPAAMIASLNVEQLGRSVLHPHPSARWHWFDAQPIYSIWRGNRDCVNADALSTIEWHGEGVLLVRPDDSVDAIAVSAAECALLDACGRGALLGDAGAVALAIDADVDLTGLLARLLRAGAFAGLEILNPTTQETR